MSRLDKLRYRTLPLLMVGLLLLLVVWVILSPAETHLGNLVKLVYVHGALVWVGLVTFSTAGGVGLLALVLRRPVWYRVTRAAGTGALVVWIIYALTAMLVTGFAWGQLIAWNEPRVQATGLILVAALVLSAVTQLVDHPDFTAAVNLAMGIVPWLVVSRADVIRHPVDPIGGSESTAIQAFFLLIELTLVALAVLLIVWLWTGLELREASSE
jgi:hypothetical protein